MANCEYVYPDGAKCPDAIWSLNLCMRHYTQKRRRRLGKTHEIAEAGEGDQITFACNHTLKEQALARAKKLKLTLGAYLRSLITRDLSNPPKSP